MFLIKFCWMFEWKKKIFNFIVWVKLYLEYVEGMIYNKLLIVKFLF